MAADQLLERLAQGQVSDLANLGFIAADHGTPEQARGYLNRALELFRRMSLPDDHPHVGVRPSDRI